MKKSVESEIKWLQAQMDAKWADHLDLLKTVQGLQYRLDELSSPPKDLSDPYPKEGPNVRNQNAHDVFSEWLRKVDKRLRQVEGGDPTSTVPRWKNICLGLSERLDKLEEKLATDSSSHQMGSFDNLYPQVQFLETRLTALGETVARNRKDHETLTELVALQAGQAEGTSDVAALERRVNGLDCDLRRAHERLDFRVGVAEAEEFCLSSATLHVSADNYKVFIGRRKGQRRTGPKERRQAEREARRLYLGNFKRRFGDHVPYTNLLRRSLTDRRQP